MRPVLKTSITAASIAALLTLATACGHTTGDRAISGAGLGAATGAVGAAVTGGSGTTGALIGAGVGAAAGALTSDRDVNLGKPIWR